MLRLSRNIIASYTNVARATYTPKRNFFGSKTEETKAAEPEVVEPEVVEQPKVEVVDEVSPLKAKIAEHSKQIDELKALNHRQELAINENMKKMKELQERVLSEVAEQENIRERAKKDINAAKMFGVSSFCKKLLDVSDTLDMASKASSKSLESDNGELNKIAEGILMTQKVFEKVLGEAGVVKFESLGLIPDPNLHDVTAQIADPSKEAGTIAFVIKEGYMIHDRVLRPAQVVLTAQVE